MIKLQYSKENLRTALSEMQPFKNIKIRTADNGSDYYEYHCFASICTVCTPLGYFWICDTTHHPCNDYYTETKTFDELEQVVEHLTSNKMLEWYWHYEITNDERNDETMKYYLEKYKD